MVVPYSLLHEYSPLRITDAEGLTRYHDVGDALKRTRMVLRLNDEVAQWCEDTFGYEPMLQRYVNRKKQAVWLRFASEADRVKFKVRFADHFPSATIG